MGFTDSGPYIPTSSSITCTTVIVCTSIMTNLHQQQQLPVSKIRLQLLFTYWIFPSSIVVQLSNAKHCPRLNNWLGRTKEYVCFQLVPVLEIQSRHFKFLPNVKKKFIKCTFSFLQATA